MAKKEMYESKRNAGVFVELVRIDTKRQEAIVKTADGKINSFTISTWKRWWKKVTVDVDTDVQDNSTDNSSNIVTTTDSTPVKNVKKVDTKKVSNKTTNIKAVPEDIDNLKNYIFNEVKKLSGEIFVPSKDINFRSFKIGGKMFCSLNYSGKSVTLNCRSKAVADCNIEPTAKVNHMFDYRFSFSEFTDETKNTIRILLQVSMDYQVHKNTNSKNNKKKGA